MGVGILASSVHSGIVPTDVPNLFYWVDAADPLTIDLSGTDVIEWRDKSANAYEFWADPSAIGPDYTGTINGLPVMTWNNSRLKSRTDLPGHVSRTYCWIMNPTDTTVVITIMSIGGVMVLKIMDDGKFHIANGNVVTFPVDCFGLHVWTAEFNGASSKVFKDGLQVWTGDAGTAGAATFRNDIGTDSFGGLPYLGYLPEMAVYSGVLSDLNRQGLETYLYSKWAGGMPGAPRLDTAIQAMRHDRRPHLDPGSQQQPGHRLRHREVGQRHQRLDGGHRERVDSDHLHRHRSDHLGHPVLPGGRRQRGRSGCRLERVERHAGSGHRCSMTSTGPTRHRSPRAVSGSERTG